KLRPRWQTSLAYDPHPVGLRGHDLVHCEWDSIVARDAATGDVLASAFLPGVPWALLIDGDRAVAHLPDPEGGSSVVRLDLGEEFGRVLWRRPSPGRDRLFVAAVNSATGRAALFHVDDQTSERVVLDTGATEWRGAVPGVWSEADSIQIARSLG